MNVFIFEWDSEAQAYCIEIAKEMSRRFEVSLFEAVARINSHWENISMERANEFLYRETEEFWSQQIYYTDDSHFWIESVNPESLRSKAKPSPKYYTLSDSVEI